RSRSRSRGDIIRSCARISSSRSCGSNSKSSGGRYTGGREGEREREVESPPGMEDEEEDKMAEKKQQDHFIPAPDQSPPREVVNSGDGEADQARGGGLGELSSSSRSSSEEEDIGEDGDPARESLPRGDSQCNPRRKAITVRNNLLLSPDASSNGEVRSRVSPSRGTAKHRPGHYDSRGPPPQRARLDWDIEPRGHTSGSGQEDDDVSHALFSSSVGNERGGEAFPEADGVADFDDAPSEIHCGGYSFDGAFDGVATPPLEDGVEESEDNVQDMRGGNVSHVVGLGGGVEEAKGEGCTEDPGNVVGTRECAVDERLWCRQDGCPYSVDGVGDDGSGGDSVTVGAGASAAGVHRLKRGRTCEQGPVQDTQTHGSATLQVGCREMDVGGSRFHDGGGAGGTSPDGKGLTDPQGNGRDTSVGRLGREMFYGGGADDPGPEGNAKYSCEGRVDGSGSGCGGSCCRVNGSDSGGHGMETRRTETTSPSDQGVEGGSIQRGYRSRGRGEDTQRGATPRMAYEALLVGGGDGLKLNDNMDRGSETAGRACVRGGNSASEGRASSRPRFGLARPGETGSGSAAGSSSVRVPRVSLEPQSMIRLHGAGVNVTAANVKPQSKADAIRKMARTVALRRKNEFGRRTGLTWSAKPDGGKGRARPGGKLCPTPDAVYEAIWEKYGSAWERSVFQQ
ncbi:unnamed protein product, partial [Ectocarpus sp. 12 AP-2014]